MTKPRPLVIYHDHCTDGFGAAFSAWTKLGDNADYVAMSYGKDLTEDIRDRRVYILDFSFPKDTMMLLVDYASEVIWLDHHKTAFEMWCPKHELPKFTQTEVIPTLGAKPVTCHIVLDNDKSGAMLAWEYFNPEIPVPDLIQRIDDRDRWVFQYPDSKALHAGLQLIKPWTFRDWAQLVSTHSDTRSYYSDTVDAGHTALQVHHQQIVSAFNRAERCAIVLNCRDQDEVPGFSRSDGYDRVYGGLAVNSTLHASEIGNELAKASGSYGLIWCYDGSTHRANCSLRSNGEYDVSAIAKAFGGGGHRNAAGFNIDMPTLLGWLKPN